LSTQNVTTQATNYTLRFEGTGSVVLSGTGSGTFTTGVNTFTATAGTLTITVTGTVSNADLRPTSQANGLVGPLYQAITTATSYNSSGFLPYLAFDGTDDSMLTNSVDFTATDKMTVWAGVRKLSDAATPMLVGTASWAASNGFGIYAPSYVSVAGGKYFVGLKGTTTSQADYATYTAPITNVLAVALDIGGAALTDEISTKINGASVAFSASSGIAGTGNFPSAAIQIGFYSSDRFNGNLYSLIIRGAQSSAAQISSTESWVNGKTGAY
jgi:hypothetical protein